MIWIALAVAMVALVLLVLAKNKNRQGTDSNLLYKKVPALFTPAERSFFGVLDQAAGKDFRLFAKVRVADVIFPNSGMSQSRRQTAFNKINRKHFDFVLCSPGDLSVVCVIELNDKSHEQKDRQDRDAFLQRTCQSAGVPLVFFQAQHAYSPIEVSAKIAEAISASSASIASVSTVLVSTGAVQTNIGNEPKGEIAPMCPKCSSAMVKRTARGGDNAGQEFWGCSNFPKCREVIAI